MTWPVAWMFGMPQSSKILPQRSLDFMSELLGTLGPDPNTQHDVRQDVRMPDELSEYLSECQLVGTTRSNSDSLAQTD